MATAETITILRPLHLRIGLEVQLARLGRQGYPHEVCGLLVGNEQGDSIEVERITSARNEAAERLADRYRLAPDDFLAADREARRDGREIVGIWHTHPDHPAIPSTTDLEAAWEGYTYLIASIVDGALADLRAWRLVGGHFAEQRIEENPS